MFDQINAALASMRDLKNIKHFSDPKHLKGSVYIWFMSLYRFSAWTWLFLTSDD